MENWLVKKAPVLRRQERRRDYISCILCVQMVWGIPEVVRQFWKRNKSGEVIKQDGKSSLRDVKY